MLTAVSALLRPTKRLISSYEVYWYEATRLPARKSESWAASALASAGRFSRSICSAWSTVAASSGFQRGGVFERLAEGAAAHELLRAVVVALRGAPELVHA